MAVTLKEVATAAGVSTAAVSKVLHGGTGTVRVSVEKAVIIREVAERLEYRPNVLARNLRNSRTRTIGLIWESFSGIASGPLYFMHLLDGIGTEILKHHYRLTILPELPNESILASLGDGQLEGVIWCKLARDAETLRLIHDCPIPIVALNAPAPSIHTEAVFVDCENEAGIELAVAHLWELGHRRIAFLSEWEDETTPDRGAREAGFKEAMTRRNAFHDEDILVWGWLLDEFGQWWQAKPPYTAVICWSERTAASLLKQALNHGVSVPNQLSVVGFDSTQFCETTHPRLTAVRQPISEMATYATRALFTLIGLTESESHSQSFPCGLDVRDSTSVPRTEDTRLKAEETL